MARSTTRLDGLAEALRAVARVPEAMRQARTETLNEWADTVQGAAEENAPRDTGNLWAALDQKIEERWGRAEVGVWDQAQTEYALYVERGTSSMAEQPYLLPAFEAARPQVVSTYRAAVRRHLRSG